MTWDHLKYSSLTLTVTVPGSPSDGARGLWSAPIRDRSARSWVKWCAASLISAAAIWTSSHRPKWFLKLLSLLTKVHSRVKIGLLWVNELESTDFALPYCVLNKEPD